MRLPPRHEPYGLLATSGFLAQKIDHQASCIVGSYVIAQAPFHFFISLEHHFPPLIPRQNPFKFGGNVLHREAVGKEFGNDFPIDNEINQ